MELSTHNSTPLLLKPNTNVMDTPRTSNLKFLRAKRLNYFCGQSSQNPLSKTEELQNVEQTARTATPRGCLIAPSSTQVPQDAGLLKEMNDEAKTRSPNGETSLQDTKEAKPSASDSLQEVQEHLRDSPAYTTQHFPTTEVKTKKPIEYRNLQTAAEKSQGPNKSIPNSLQPKISNPPVLAILHTLQPVTKENTKGILMQHVPQAVPEKSEGKDPDLQSSQKETEVKEFSTYHDLLATPKQVKDERYLPQVKLETDEVDRLSTQRSLLRSSFVTDLNQDFLEDVSVPESEKLHHVMTWAKKFLNKCSEGEVISDNSDILSKNMGENSSFKSIGSSRLTGNYPKLKSRGFDDLKKHPYPSEEPKKSASGQSRLVKSPRSLYKPKSKTNTVLLDAFFAEPKSDFLDIDYEENEDNVSDSSCDAYSQLVKNNDVKDTFNIKAYDDLGENVFDHTKQGCIDSDGLLGNRAKPNQQHYNTHVLGETKSDMASKDNYINREDTSTSPESCLSTERLNFLLEDFKLVEKCFEKTGEVDDAKTDRTFLVKKCEKSDDSTYISMPGKIPALPRVDSKRSLSEGYTRQTYQVCPACSFFNTTSSNWCTECGSVVNCAKNQLTRNNGHFELPKPHIFDDNTIDEFFSVNNERKDFDNNPMSKQNARELGRTVCWEDNPDVVSDSEGSVLEKYAFYVKQLDVLRSQEKGKQAKHFQDKDTSETSSDDESSEEYSMPHVRSGPPRPWGETKTLGPDTYHLYGPAMKENNVKGSSEDIEGDKGSNPKDLLDRKLQKVADMASKVTGPVRYWEKSSIAWSSYTHGELKPRSLHNIQRPTSADYKKNKDQLQGDKATGKVCEAKNGSMWLLLPDEMWIYIFSLLSHGDLSKVAQVCRRFRYIANDDTLWKVIKVTNCHSLKDSCLASIGLHHPESISLYRCHNDTDTITDEAFRQLFQYCKDSLKKLNITNCSGDIFKGDTVLFYASHYCTQLTSVDISWTGATDKGIISLVQASTCLQSLSMNGCNITDNAINALLKRHCKSLIKLEIFGCLALTAKCLISVATECVHLETLNIGRIPKVTDACLAKVASNLHKITTLNLTSLNVVRDRAVHHIVKQCSELENLTLSSCLQVTDVSLMEISTYRTTIKYLDLSGCKKVSDIGIQALARSCQHLRYLDLSSTAAGKRGVCLLASYCHATLECLKLNFCKDVTADAIEKLCKYCKRLKVLHLYGCRVSPNLGYIKKFSKSFQILHDFSIPMANIIGE
ncbi:hypothetical protein GDO78_006936 [Eleutherodactylus coqui]|uniref:F-box domain-containing protein n=1 Tax=Eleutherodactylus coqui TaxID=57060 RepID=A0A8J6KBF9_ELECQ|nr:hypothetical protein GDO78_006936 [Eleutherodactylus coqui]